MLQRSNTGSAVGILDITTTLQRSLAAAGLDRSKKVAAVGRTLRKALKVAGLAPRSNDPDTSPVDAPARPTARRKLAAHDAATARPRARREQGGSFTTHAYANDAGRRDYKLYVPAGHDDGRPLPLIVMLHGCKQDPDDFARGTRMNALADAQGFLVAYPAQTARSHGNNCWTWYSPADQIRNGTEPSLIAGITADIARLHRVDASRVFVAGLSAGAAMAVILGAAYPEVFRAVAAHSGLPRGAAHDVTSAFAAMHGHPARDASPSRLVDHVNVFVPTIVIHGDGDGTVVASNGRQITEQAVRAFEATSPETLSPQIEAHRVAGGRDCALVRYVDDAGRTMVEEWTVHGAGHAWYGGDTSGSFTAADGPDASAEIVRFFMESVAADEA